MDIITIVRENKIEVKSNKDLHNDRVLRAIGKTDEVNSLTNLKII